MNTQSKLKKIKGNKQKLKLFRSNDPLKSVLMWGINYSMSQLAHVKRKAVLMDEDFKGFIKAAIENHQFNKEYMPSHYKFKEYAPMVFLDLRRRFEVDDREFLESLTACPPLRLKKTAKKLSCLLLSQDRRYAVRIITADDASFIQTWIADYHEHVVQQHGATLLSHLLALYRVTVNDQQTHMVVMRNIPYPPGHLTRLYLLEGTAVTESKGDSGSSSKELGARAYNDNQLGTDELRLMLDVEDRAWLLQTLWNDMLFLETNKMGKYKLMLGLRDAEAQRYKRTEGEAASGANRCALPMCSEEEDEEGVAGTTAVDGACESTDENEIEQEMAQLISQPGTRIGPFGFKDRVDPTIVCYLGLVDFYKRQRHHHGGGGGAAGGGVGSSRKTSVSLGRRDSQTAAAAAAGGASPPQETGGEAVGGPPSSGGKQLSGRLINTVTQLLQ